ncbi:replication initiator protein [Peromfec virus RodF5_5]|uniref:Replication initiator protein n=1 Tax=Peromfec virus RodF5_5 TaxID=2929341 RepID=A0A976N2K6_9VIRU|nr:replication initiator protein [Peromfec virus RodF5_5]
MCLNYSVHINPLVYRYANEIKDFTLGGELYKYHSYGELKGDALQAILNRGLVDKDFYAIQFNKLENFNNASKVFLYNNASYPLYIFFKCGVCSECTLEKKTDYESRLLLEARDFPYVVFFTLTYDNKHLPSLGLNRKHVSDSLKRFRIRLDRLMPSNDIHFRCFYVGEYGSRHGRPHYHGLLFFNRKLSYPELWKVKGIFYDRPQYLTGKDGRKLMKVWPFGFKRDFQECKDIHKSARYVSKYIMKSQIIDNRELASKGFVMDNFCRGPHQHGGLGCFNMSANKDIIAHSEDGKMRFLLGSKVCSCKVPACVLRKIFPSPSSHLAGAKLLFEELNTIVNACKSIVYDLHNRDYQTQYHELLHYVNEYSFLSRSLTVTPKMRRRLDCYHAIYNDYHKTFYPRSFIYKSEQQHSTRGIVCPIGVYVYTPEIQLTRVLLPRAYEIVQIFVNSLYDYNFYLQKVFEKSQFYSKFAANKFDAGEIRQLRAYIYENQYYKITGRQFVYELE